MPFNIELGTCTDVHESMQTKFSAKRTRQQLLSVIAHSHVTIFTVDPSRLVTMLEGALIWNNTYEENHDGTRWFIGENMYTVFNRLTEQLPEGERPEFLQPIEDILDGVSSEDVKEHSIGTSIPALLCRCCETDAVQMTAFIELDSCPCTAKSPEKARRRARAALKESLASSWT